MYEWNDHIHSNINTATIIFREAYWKYYFLHFIIKKVLHLSLPKVTSRTYAYTYWKSQKNKNKSYAHIVTLLMNILN